jgi:hypothetical protein
MKWFWIVLVVIGGVFAYQRMQQPDMPAPSPEHAQITQMAKQAEAKAQQAAVIASQDTVAEYEKQQQ